MKRNKILIVDDEADFCSSVGGFLQNHDYEVLTATTGAEGLRLATAQQPDLILLDIRMDDINGFDVLTKIRERKIPTRIIMVTGHKATIADAVKYVRAGACDFYLKGPLFSEKLIQVIERNIEVETTLNLQVSNPAPIVEELMSGVKSLSSQKEELQDKVGVLERKLSYRPLLITSAVNLTLLGVSVGLTLVLRYMTAITDILVMVGLPVVLFFILRLPIERFSKGSLDVPGVGRGGIEIDPSNEHDPNKP